MEDNNYKKRDSFFQLVIGLITGAVSVSVALSYNDFSKELFTKIFRKQSGLFIKSLHLLLITIISVVLVYSLQSVNEKFVERSYENKKSDEVCFCPQNSQKKLSKV